MRRLVMRTLCATLFAAAVLSAQSAKPEDDVVLRAMADELARSRALRVLDLDRPYYIEYSIEDADVLSLSASLGGIVVANRYRQRIPAVQVRVGAYESDNTNHIYSSAYTGSRYDPDQWPLDNNYALLRHDLWLATDRAYKTAIEAIARKKASLKEVASPDTIADFSRTEPIRNIQRVQRSALDQTLWTNRVRALSTVFSDYPEIISSTIDLESFQGISYFATSEGAAQRSSDILNQVRIIAHAQAPDGAMLHEAMVFPALDNNGLPSELELRRASTTVAEDLRALLKAPSGEEYSGPVLFEGQAGPQLLAQLLGDNLRVPRRPVSDPGRPAPFSASELEGKVGSRILPEWMDVVDDATQTEWRGRKLAGHYEFDMEGVPPQPVIAVEKGILKGFLMTRQPIRGASGSNGHARLGGNFGTRSAGISNLFVKASQTKPVADLKKQLIEMCKQRSKPYGILIRKLDYPSAASFRELQSIAQSSMQSGGGAHPLSPPLMAYRIYPDGREELVRGLRFRGVNARSLRDVAAASEETYVFDFVNNGAPFAVIGAGGYLAPASVVAPALLFEDMELDIGREERSNPPIVAPPPITK